MPTYTDNTAPRYEMLPEGDYIWTVEDFNIGLSQSAKTAGRENYKVQFKLESPDGLKSGACQETLIDHPSTIWKLDCFLKSGGIVLAKGEAYEFNASKAKAAGIRWVDPMGLRGWCRVIVEEFDKKDRSTGKPTGEKGRSNKISVFYTDKEKIDRAIKETPVSEPIGDDDFQ